MAVSFNDYMPKIWNDLMAEFNNETGVAGLMGNLYAESGCTPYACQPTRPYPVCETYIDNVDSHRISRDDFINHGCSADGGVSSGQLGFGLAQWTYYTRKEGLYDYMFANGSSIGNLSNQIQYVIQEIRSDSTMWDIVANATDINTVADYILLNYENPKDKSVTVKKVRRGYAVDIYNEYSGSVPIEPVDPEPPSTDNTPIPWSEEVYRSENKMPLWMMLIRRKYIAT